MSDTNPAPTHRLFHDDPYLFRFDASVLSCRDRDGGRELCLDRSAFYATSGGQPNDLGILAGRPVSDVVDEEGRLWHRLAGNEGPAPGERVQGEVDAARRLDHMQQHTGQHILSQSFIRTGGAETVSFHLGVDSVTIDLATAGVSEGDLMRAEALANDTILADRPVRTHWTTAAELHRFPLRKPPAVEGAIRIVEIDDFDWSACGGTHVARTGEIGVIKILRSEKVRQGIRVEFLCGRRALRDYAFKHDLVRSTAERFSTRDRELDASIRRLEEEHAAARARLKKLEEGALDREAELLAKEAAPDARGRRWFVSGEGGRSLDELKGLAQRLQKISGAIILLASAGGDGKVAYLFARAEGVPGDAGKTLGPLLSSLGGRGGGRPEMAQGSAPDPARVAETLKAARAQFEEAS